jgi:hypothetical protein
LYTDSVVVAIKIRRPPTAWTTSWIRRGRRSAPASVVAAAAADMRVTASICCSSTTVPAVVSTNFASTHQYRNSPHRVPSDWRSPVTIAAMLNGTMMNQPISFMDA